MYSGMSLVCSLGSRVEWSTLLNPPLISRNMVLALRPAACASTCNDPTIGSYNHYHLSPNGIPRGNQRWYGLVYLIQIAGKPRIRPRE